MNSPSEIVKAAQWLQQTSQPAPAAAPEGAERAVNVRQFRAQVHDPFERADRLLCSFSCGAASAVATKLAIEANAGRLPVHIMYLETRSEHDDNGRFLRDCEKWFGVEVTRYGSAKYADIWDVFERGRYIAGEAA